MVPLLKQHLFILHQEKGYFYPLDQAVVDYIMMLCI